MSKAINTKGFQLTPVWEHPPDAVREEVIKFWKREGVVSVGAMEERTKQLLLIASNAQDEIIGVSTAVKTKVKLLNDNWLYQYRCFISPRSRAIGFDVHLTQESLKILEDTAQNDPDKPIGVFVVVENPNLMKHKLHKAAVWRAYKMYFIGFNSKGQPIRVYYFKGARI